MSFRNYTGNGRAIFYVSMILFLLFTVGCNQQAADSSVQEDGISYYDPEMVRDIPGLSAQRGLVVKTGEATPGYVIFCPSLSTSTYLINLDGEVVHEWKGDRQSMLAYLQEDGSIIRHERVLDDKTFAAGGQSGIISRYSWDSELEWRFRYATPTLLTHHDLAVMPNGNILANAWEVKTKEECIELGLNPEALPDEGLWFDKVIEIKPDGKDGGEVVWEWRMWDHLVQDIDASKANYGNPAESPRKLNLNPYVFKDPIPEEAIAEMIKMGVTTSNQRPGNMGSDVTHLNAINYNADLDQIALSSYWFNEVFIIDHSTTTAEAAGSSGGRYGHGGDLLYRWGNPQNYGRGGPEDGILSKQHDVQWIPEGYPGAGNLMIYNNDVYGGHGQFKSVFEAIPALQRPTMTLAEIDNYSMVLEIETPMSSPGEYVLPEDGPFGPENPTWSYVAQDTFSFYGAFISGTQRLENGNTFINSGPRGRFFEVTPDKEIVWEYWNPYFFDYKMPDGTVPQPTAFFFWAQYRAYHVADDHAALAGKTLSPIDPQPAPFVPGPPPGEGDH